MKNCSVYLEIDLNNVIRMKLISYSEHRYWIYAACYVKYFEIIMFALRGKSATADTCYKLCQGFIGFSSFNRFKQLKNFLDKEHAFM